MASAGRRLVILYGSQTGTAQDVAERLAREALNRCFSVHMCPMDDFALKELANEPFVVFVSSTTGCGQEPDNMATFWRHLRRRSIPVDALRAVNFGLFGLGDSSYEKYNLTGRRLFRRLLQLGAQPICEKGEGDDQHYLGLDGTLDGWLNTFWANLMVLCPMPAGTVAREDSELPEPRYRFCTIPKSSGNAPKSTLLVPTTTQDDSNVVQNVRVTVSDHFQDTRMLTISLPCPINDSTRNPTAVEPGDVLRISPITENAAVLQVCAMFGWDADAIFHIKPQNKRWPSAVSAKYGGCQSLRSLLSAYLAPCAAAGSPLRRHALRLLSDAAEDPIKSAKLAYLASAEGYDDLFEYAVRPRRTCLEVLVDFGPYKLHHVAPEHCFDFFPEIHPRAYSVSGCQNTASKAHGTGPHKIQVDILAAIVEYRTNLASPRVGLCSRTLRCLQAGDTVSARLHRAETFRPPKSPCVPVICIATGTGIAPVRFLLEHQCTRGAAKNTLFFGVRYSLKDYYFKEFFESCVQKGFLTLHMAFSRDQPQKRHVQALIAENSRRVAELIFDQNASVYLAGNSKQMPEDVTAALVSALSLHAFHSPQDEAAASIYIQEMKSSGRFRRETWA